VPELFIRAFRVNRLASRIPTSRRPGSESLNQAVPGVALAVDQARHDDHSCCVDGLGRGRICLIIAFGSDTDYSVVLNRDHAIVDDSTIWVRSDDRAAGY